MDYKEYREKWEKYPKEFEVGKVPLHLDLEVTTLCNLKCIMCEHSFNPPEPMNLDVELGKKIISEFAEKGGCSIKFCYLGEPLLYQPLCELIAYAKELGVIDTMLATNGNLLTEQKVKDLVESGLDMVIVSIDSYRPHIYEKIRVNGKLNNVIKGMVYLNKYRKNKKPKIQIQAIPIKPLNDLEINLGQFNAFWKSFADVIRISPYCEDYHQDKDIGITPDFKCSSVWRRLTIRVDGKICICCGRRSEDKVLGDYTKGDTIESIWCGKEFTRIRKLMSEGKAHLIKACKRCDFRLH